MSRDVQSRFVEPQPQPDWPPERNTVDLHCHTDRSDGVLSPLALVTAMAEWGIRVAAISDHDTLAGYRWLRDAAANSQLPANSPRLIPTVEINSVADRGLIELGVELEEGELHILGYGVDPDDETFESKRAGQRNARMDRLHLIIDKLRELNVPIDDQIAPALASEEAVGRPHIARAMVAAGHVATVQEAFDKWIDRNGPAYVPRQGMKSRAAIDAILDAGGVPVLAHYPAAPEQPSLIKLITDWGIRGLEVYYRRFTAQTVTSMEELAGELGLLATGGSDYHGDTGSYAEAMATTYVPAAIGDRLIAAVAESSARERTLD
jgi:predicted metal-dependent phosphoesterase TrpH